MDTVMDVKKFFQEKNVIACRKANCHEIVEVEDSLKDKLHWTKFALSMDFNIDGGKYARELTKKKLVCSPVFSYLELIGRDGEIYYLVSDAQKLEWYMQSCKKSSNGAPKMLLDYISDERRQIKKFYVCGSLHEKCNGIIYLDELGAAVWEKGKKYYLTTDFQCETSEFMGSRFVQKIQKKYDESYLWMQERVDIFFLTQLSKEMIDMIKTPEDIRVQKKELEERDRKRKEEENRRQEEEKNKEYNKKLDQILDDILEINPFKEYVFIGFRQVDVFFTDKDGAQELRSTQFSMIELVMRDASMFYLCFEKASDAHIHKFLDRPRRNEEFDREQIFNVPYERKDVEKALEIIMPRFDNAKIKLDVQVHRQVMSVYRDDYSIDDIKAKGSCFVSPEEIEGLSINSFLWISQLCSIWGNNNFIQILGVEPAKYWEGLIKALRPMLDKRDDLQMEYDKRLETSDDMERIHRDMERMRQATQEAEKLEKEKKKEAVEKAGSEGEQRVAYALKWLAADGNFFVINSESSDEGEPRHLFLYNEEYIDEKQEIDHIVVGRQGVFVIETKNYSGEIEIDQNGNWTRTKEGRRTGEASPVQQVTRHERLVQSFLPKDVPVISIICIANPSAVVIGTENSAYPVVKCDLLQQYIENYDSGVTVSKEIVERCIELIKRHIVE